MPGRNCSIPQCTVYQHKDGPSVFKVTKQTDDWSNEWRTKIISVIKQYREVDKDFKRQIESLNIAVCELHYKESCLIRRKFSLKV